MPSKVNIALLRFDLLFTKDTVSHRTHHRPVGKVSRVAPSRDRTEAGTARKRAQKACKECHLHKTKCSGDIPRCKRCETNDLICEYVASRRKFSHAPTLQSSSQDDNQEVEDRPSLTDVKDDAKPLISPVGFSISPALTSQTRRSSIGNLYGEYVPKYYSRRTLETHGIIEIFWLKKIPW